LREGDTIAVGFDDTKQEINIKIQKNKKSTKAESKDS
jgi:hypothetical protein